MKDKDRVQIVSVPEAHQGQRIDNFLLRHLKGVPRSHVYRIIRRGEVRLNKKRCKPHQKLSCGDQVRIPPVATNEKPPAAPSPALERLLNESVLLEEERFLVLNKPAGLAVHGGSGLRHGLIQSLRQLRPEWAQAELAHRLDRDTSGCILIAKNSKFLKYIQQKFKENSIDKQYLSLVHGRWPEEVAEVTAPLLKNELSGGERIVRVTREGKPATTRYRILQRFKEATLLEVHPVSGRTHQIRVHCQYTGHAIVGDTKYAVPKGTARISGAKFLCLHAASLSFDPGQGEEPVTVSAPTPPNFQGLLESLEQ